MGKIRDAIINQKTPGKFEKNFWDKVAMTDNDDDCWEWMGYATDTEKKSKHRGYRVHDGYGKVKLPNTTITERAHRVAYFLGHDEDPSDTNMFVMHSCDNPRCCNPFHLSLGTHKDNMKDMVEKGRSNNGNVPKHGEENGNSVLTEADVVNIWGRIQGGDTNVAIAKDYGVTHSMISCIRRGKNWSEVTSLL